MTDYHHRQDPESSAGVSVSTLTASLVQDRPEEMAAPRSGHKERMPKAPSCRVCAPSQGDKEGQLCVGPALGTLPPPVCAKPLHQKAHSPPRGSSALA